MNIVSEKILHNLYIIDFLNFGLSEFCFQLEFFFNFDFQMEKNPSKKLLFFEILFIGGYSSTFYLFDGKV